MRYARRGEGAGRVMQAGGGSCRRMSKGPNEDRTVTEEEIEIMYSVINAFMDMW